MQPIDNYQPQTIAEVGRLLLAAFPTLRPEFVELLLERAMRYGITDEALIDAVYRVIDTHRYPTVTIADIIDRGATKLLTYNEMLKLVSDYGSGIWQDYEVVEVKGRKYWTKKKA